MVGNVQVTAEVEALWEAWSITIPLPLYWTLQRGDCCPSAASWTSRAPLPTGEGESKEPESGLREWTAEPTLWDR
jgi:hypothetical protein